MKLIVAKTIVRVLGTIFGLFGLFAAWMAVELVFYLPWEASRWMWLISGCVLAIGAISMYISYIVWYQLTPAVVRGVCGLFALYLWGVPVQILDPAHTGHVPFAFLVLLGWPVALYFIYRFGTNWLNRQLFSSDDSHVQMPT